MKTYKTPHTTIVQATPMNTLLSSGNPAAMFSINVNNGKLTFGRKTIDADNAW